MYNKLHCTQYIATVLSPQSYQATYQIHFLNQLLCITMAKLFSSFYFYLLENSSRKQFWL